LGPGDALGAGRARDRLLGHDHTEIGRELVDAERVALSLADGVSEELGEFHASIGPVRCEVDDLLIGILQAADTAAQVADRSK
jgi:hypothetical protein